MENQLLIQCYQEWLKWDTAALKQNQGELAYFASLAKKHLDDKKMHDMWLEIIDLLAQEQTKLIKDIQYNRTRLGYKEGGDGIRFRME